MAELTSAAAATVPTRAAAQAGAAAIAGPGEYTICLDGEWRNLLVVERLLAGAGA